MPRPRATMGGSGMLNNPYWHNGGGARYYRP
jgi:hypothetical protein